VHATIYSIIYLICIFLFCLKQCT